MFLFKNQCTYILSSPLVSIPLGKIDEVRIFFKAKLLI